MNDTDTLAELRAWRDEFARSHGYDLGAMVATLRALDAGASAPVVCGEPRRPVAVPSQEAQPPKQSPQSGPTGALPEYSPR
jgi:hypothetical protein